MNRVKFINAVNKTRIALNLSVRELAALASVSVSAIHNLQKNNSPSKPQTYARIITALHATIDAELFSEDLKKKRESLRLSILSLSKWIGVSYNTLYKIDTNNLIPSIKTCCKIAQKLHMPLDELIRWPDKKVF